jgi:hypothetical protein
VQQSTCQEREVTNNVNETSSQHELEESENEDVDQMENEAIDDVENEI